MRVAACAEWVSDGLTGKVIYGHVMDSCADNNFWCQDDTFHLDISRSYLTGMGLTQGKNWNGREVIWQYMTGAPPGYAPSGLLQLIDRARAPAAQE